MHTASKLSLALLALTLVGTSVAQAQSANISATATVLTPLTLTGTAEITAIAAGADILVIGRAITGAADPAAAAQKILEDLRHG